jgi:hypothetical protein
MTWNYRLIRHTSNGEEYIAIHSVYYDANSNPIFCSKDPAYIASEDIVGISDEIDRFLVAMSKPVIDYDHFSKLAKE